jgi:hypothetical protein
MGSSESDARRVQVARALTESEHPVSGEGGPGDPGSIAHDPSFEADGLVRILQAPAKNAPSPSTASLLAAGLGGDVGIVTEPTGLNVAVAQRGRAFFDIAVRGRPRGSGRRAPERGGLPAPTPLSPGRGESHQLVRGRDSDRQRAPTERPATFFGTAARPIATSSFMSEKRKLS